MQDEARRPRKQESAGDRLAAVDLARVRLRVMHAQDDRDVAPPSAHPDAEGKPRRHVRIVDMEDVRSQSLDVLDGLTGDAERPRVERAAPAVHDEGKTGKVAPIRARPIREVRRQDGIGSMKPGS